VAYGQEVGSVQGRIVNDNTGQGIPNVQVILQGRSPQGRPPLVDSYVVQTDEQGRFAVGDVIPGIYDTRIARRGFELARNDDRESVVACNSGSDPLTVSRGSVAHADFRMTPLGAVSGRVVDENGDPVSHAKVEAVQLSYDRGRVSPRAIGDTAETDDRGEFRIPDLQPGRHFLRFEPGGSDIGMIYFIVRGPRVPQAFPITYFPDSVDIEHARELEVKAGEELADATIVVRRRSFHEIRVTTLGSPDPADEASLLVTIKSDTGFGLSGPGRYGGAHPFPGLLPGLYQIEVEDTRRQLYGRKTVILGEADEQVTLTLQPPLTLNGNVRFDRSVKPDLGGIWVALETDDAIGRRAAETNTDGSFILSHCQRVVYRIHVEVPAGKCLKAIRAGDRSLTQPVIDMDDATGPLTIILGEDGGSVEGSLLPAENGFTAAQAFLFPSEDWREWKDLIRATAVDRSGKFVFRDITPGIYRIYAWAELDAGAALQETFRKQFDALAAIVEVKAGSATKVRVPLLPRHPPN
jgi:hypothetical protein